jgi:hypothetical protein
MYAYRKNTSHQPESQTLVLTKFSWFKQMLEAFRQQQAKKRLLKELEALDRHILEDIGVNVPTLGKTYPSFADLNSRIIAVGIFAECHSFAKITNSQ